MNTTPVNQRDSIESLHGRLDVLSEQVAYLVSQKKKQEELFTDFTPIAKDALNQASLFMGELEKEGAFAFGKELLTVTRNVVRGYSPEDVRQLANAIVKILDTVRALTQPEVLTVLDHASEVLQRADSTEPIGIMGMVKASRNDDVQKGMAVLMELLRHVGRGAKAIAEQRNVGASHPSATPRNVESEALNRKAKLAARLGPSREKIPGPNGEQPNPLQRSDKRGDSTSDPHIREAARAEILDLGPPTTCVPPSPSEREIATFLDGVAFNKDGHLADPAQWTRELALNIAAAEGISLDEKRWKIIETARADYEAHGASPNVRRITMATGIATRDLYTMFPRAPARTVAKIAGIPKPAGCI